MKHLCGEFSHEKQHVEVLELTAVVTVMIVMMMMAALLRSSICNDCLLCLKDDVTEYEAKIQIPCTFPARSTMSHHMP